MKKSPFDKRKQKPGGRARFVAPRIDAPKAVYVAPPAWRAPPATWKGLIVPFVALWSSEQVMTSVVEDRLSVQALVPEQTVPGGFPILGRMECRRQRRAVLDSLCQVCAKPLGRWRWSPAFGRAVGEGFPKRWLGDGFLRSEPPSCRRCAAIAVRICPGLLKRKPSFQAVSDAKLFPQVLSGASMKEAGGYKGDVGQVVGYIEYVVQASHEWHEFDAFVAMTAADLGDDGEAIVREQRTAARALQIEALREKTDPPT